MTVRYQRSDQDFYYNQDSSLNSSQTSVGIDDYLDEALIDDYGITQNDDSHDDLDSHLSRGQRKPGPNELPYYWRSGDHGPQRPIRQAAAGNITCARAGAARKRAPKEQGQKGLSSAIDISMPRKTSRRREILNPSYP
ncbi:uncharacterized protein LOC108158324 isoform X1 [Drosophila miranda]|uniref:uncharacterized protein LOC108158324 isoform X1 n=1 Tax=Drosophila miranda TaxID=7229 RepID=UPI0007E74744|nr:uncharacterized protein LOC108158324 isoform X1 [Drosophila miranda]